jgi:hypothetical protein
MYRVLENKYIENVKDGDKIKTFYSGDQLPDDYIPPADYITNKIVEEVKIEVKKSRVKENLEVEL